MTGRKQQHPCHGCGKDLQSDDMFDVIMQQRKPKANRFSSRSTVKRYLPPERIVVEHLYLCHECAENFQEFMSLYARR